MQKYIVDIPEDSLFSISNIPFGVVAFQGKQFCATRIGQYVLDLGQVELLKLFNGPLMSDLKQSVFQGNTLNKFMGLSRPYWKEARQTIQSLLKQGSQLKDGKGFIYQINSIKYRLPCIIGDYTDFYSSKSHAFNVGSIIRGPQNALQQNWLHLPVGYHGRSSSIVVSGTPLRRPRGQTKPPTEKQPSFNVCKRLDFQIEMGAFLGGKLNQLGSSIKVNQAIDYVFGLVLLNDWSARDFQTWEYVPLGPFTAKNLMTSISPWIITLQALEPMKVQLQKQNPTPLKYLDQKQHCSYNIDMSLSVNGKHLVKTNFKYLYWSITQQLTHHSISGCNMKPGDLLGSGTISGNEKSQYGSLLQLTWGGKQVFNGQSWLQDGDQVVIEGFAGKGIGFGHVAGKILPTHSQQAYY